MTSNNYSHFISKMTEAPFGSGRSDSDEDDIIEDYDEAVSFKTPCLRNRTSLERFLLIVLLVCLVIIIGLAVGLTRPQIVPGQSELFGNHTLAVFVPLLCTAITVLFSPVAALKFIFILTFIFLHIGSCIIFINITRLFVCRFVSFILFYFV